MVVPFEQQHNRHQCATPENECRLAHTPTQKDPAQQCRQRARADAAAHVAFLCRLQVVGVDDGAEHHAHCTRSRLPLPQRTPSAMSDTAFSFCARSIITFMPPACCLSNKLIIAGLCSVVNMQFIQFQSIFLSKLHNIHCAPCPCANVPFICFSILPDDIGQPACAGCPVFQRLQSFASRQSRMEDRKDRLYDSAILQSCRTLVHAVKVVLVDDRDRAVDLTRHALPVQRTDRRHNTSDTTADRHPEKP